MARLSECDRCDNKKVMMFSNEYCINCRKQVRKKIQIRSSSRSKTIYERHKDSLKHHKYIKRVLI